ncbi:MAG: hypothetical protein R3E96_10620 [Planctomycetota bacterium]
MRRAHSDKRLGTVERLARRRPDLKIAVVSIVASPEEMPENPAELADWLWIFPEAQ